MKKYLILGITALSMLIMTDSEAQNYEHLTAGWTGAESIGVGARMDGDWSVFLSYNHRLGSFANANFIKFDVELGLDEGPSEIAAGMQFNCTMGNDGTTFGSGGFGFNLAGLLWYEYRLDAHEASIQQNRPVAAHAVSAGLSGRPGYFKNELSLTADFDIELVKLYVNDNTAIGQVDEGDSGGAGLQVTYLNDLQIGPHFDYFKNNVHFLVEAKYAMYFDRFNPDDHEEVEDDGVHPTQPFNLSTAIYYRF